MSQQISKTHSLNKQLESLLENAPNDDVTIRAISIIAPILKEIASQLQHTSYYVIQAADGGWLLTTLSNRNSPEIEKNVVYAYCSHNTANIERVKVDPSSIYVEIGIIEMLFHLLGLPQVDSLILFDQSTDTQKGVEISRADLQALCEKQVRRVQIGRQKLMKSRSQSKNSTSHIA